MHYCTAADAVSLDRAYFVQSAEAFCKCFVMRVNSNSQRPSHYKEHDDENVTCALLLAMKSSPLQMAYRLPLFYYSQHIHKYLIHGN